MAPPMKIRLETEMRQRLSMPPTSRGEIVSRHFLSNSKRTCLDLLAQLFTHLNSRHKATKLDNKKLNIFTFKKEGNGNHEGYWNCR